MLKFTSRTARDRGSFLSDDQGAFDIGSILFGVFILALGATMIGLTYTKLVPWVKDVVVENDAQTVATAMDLHQSQVAAGNITATAYYVDAAKLVEAGLLTKAPANVTVTVSGGDTANNFADDGYTITYKAKGVDKTIKGGVTP